MNAANDTTRDTSVVRVVNGPRVSVLQPAVGAVTATGKSVTVQVRGIHPLGVKILGWRATGVVAKNDSHDLQSGLRRAGGYADLHQYAADPGGHGGGQPS